MKKHSKLCPVSAGYTDCHCSRPVIKKSLITEKCYCGKERVIATGLCEEHLKRNEEQTKVFNNKGFIPKAPWSPCIGEGCNHSSHKPKEICSCGSNTAFIENFQEICADCKKPTGATVPYSQKLSPTFQGDAYGAIN